MIGKLSGNIDSIGEQHCIIDVQGVGYVVHASRRTLSKAGQAGDRASLLVETLVREDAITLYGFTDESEKAWFRLLTGVQGVGARAALAILSVCPPDQMGVVIASEDKTALTRADGVGPKIAGRIISELKDKVPEVHVMNEATRSGAPAAHAGPPSAPSPVPSVDSDAVSALVNLGYARSDAYAAVMRARGKTGAGEEGGSDTVQAVIRLALKELGA